MKKRLESLKSSTLFKEIAGSMPLTALTEESMIEELNSLILANVTKTIVFVTNNINLILHFEDQCIPCQSFTEDQDGLTYIPTYLSTL